MTESDASFDRFFDSMESLADTIGETLQSQVTIEDENHHVIGYSSHHFESDPARISTIIGKRVPNSVIAGLRRKGIMQQLETSVSPLRVPAVSEVGLGPRLAMCIKHQNEVLGYIWVVDTGNLVSGHAESIVEKAAKIAGRYLLKQRGWRARQDKVHEDFLWKLLTSHYDTESRLRQDAEALSILLAKTYRIAVFETGKAVDEPLLHAFRQAVEGQSQVRLLFLTSEHDRIIALFSFIMPGEGAEEVSVFMHRLVDRMAKSEGGHVLAGCSPNCDSYMAAAGAYREALSVVEIRKLLPFHARGLLLFEEIGFLVHIPAMIEYKRARNRPSPLLHPLQEHDREHKSDFVKTIAVYLSFNGNLKEAAAFLHIHTNTLMYRLNRITEITGKSLKDTHYRTSIYLDLLTEETAQVNHWLAGGHL